MNNYYSSKYRPRFHEWKTNSVAMFLLLITLLIVPDASSQQSQKFPSCSTKEKCDECIRTFDCVWCADPTYQEKRCQPKKQTRCSAEYIMNPQIEATVLQALNLTEVHPYNQFDHQESNQVNVVQVTPQEIHLKLRPNEGHPYRIWVNYRQAVDYPVDLYYLMDLSNSMSDDKDKLSALGNQLAEAMRKMTRNFRLGFGSFVDKVAMPYVNIVPKYLQEPCSGCAAPYGFRNVMPLSQDTSQFEGQVMSASVSGNLDAPEGGFDAIMQTIVCQREIGWREKARKLLVFSTDSSFHFAGDGKLAGILTPNDGCCHLDHRGYYSYSTMQDYPSVSQINMKVKEHSINMIFAVTSDQIDLYQLLGNHVEGSFCGVLSNDSSNVVELVREQYSKITSSVEMREKDLGNHLRVRYYSRCLDPYGPLVETNKCNGLKVGETVQFEIDVEMLSCPPNREDWIHTFSIYPVGVSESMLVRVEMQCDCDCSAPQYVEVSSPRCSYHGTLKCGVCECDVGFSGDDCNCTGEADKTDNCRENSGAPICSDHGVCKCNKCHCNNVTENEAFWGEFCQCNNFSCPRVKGELCAGHGTCVCGHCQCAPGWKGDNCACEDSEDNCMALGGQICSGHGKCVCNRCECDQAGGYFGRVCDKCPNCPTKCNELKDCVECKVHNSGILSKEECEKKCTVAIDVVDTLEVTDQDNFCSHYDDRDCRFTYKYEIVGKDLKVTAKKDKECPPQAYIPGVVFSVISSIVLIGLAFLLLWKILTSMRDRREYAKFEKERMMAKWDAGQNPIYKGATTTFKNPTYCAT